MAATLVEAERTGPGFDGDASPEKAHGDEPEQPQDGEQDAEEKVDHKDGDGGSDSDDEPPSYRVAVRAWCSWCHTEAEHELVEVNPPWRDQYRCCQCKSTTCRCTNGCGAMTAGSTGHLCAVCQGLRKRWTTAKVAPLAKVTGFGKERRPLWEADESAIRCLHCLSDFSVLNRRHHCRGCGRVLCNSCCATRAPIPALGYKEPVRICASCEVTLR